MQHEFFEVDVFATGAFNGNALAVIAGADGLSNQQMQAIANWTNFSETTFLLEPSNARADYRVRIFTPYEEFDFAGHQPWAALPRGGRWAPSRRRRDVSSRSAARDW